MVHATSGPSAMTHQLLAVWLVAILLGAGQVESPCPQGHCWQARTMTCCQHDGITRSSCCPPIQQLSARALTETVDSTAKAMRAATGSSSLVRVVASVAIPVATRSGAPPGALPATLFSKRTSLIL